MKCGRPCEVYSRVVGYYRPVADWNVGKKEEFKDRKPYNLGGGAAPSRAPQLSTKDTNPVTHGATLESHEEE